MAYGIQIEVWGERALFTRPELSVERVSYDVITPSAARGLIESARQLHKKRHDARRRVALHKHERGYPATSLTDPH